MLEWRITDKFLELHAPEVTARFTWKVYPTIVETPQGFLLYQNASTFSWWFPRHGFLGDADIERFSQWARLHAVRYRPLK